MEDSTTAAATATNRSSIRGKDTNDQHAPSLRRSGRERKTTTMKIDGHIVLRKNNYTVRGMNYVFDIHDEDDDDEIKSQKRPAKKAKTSATSIISKPRPLSQAQMGRKTHNAAVLLAATQKKALRLAFFAKHMDLLKPFCEETVLERLKQEAAKLDATKMEMEIAEDLPIAQPAMIQATLRNYQMKGLEFMVRMHRQNLAMILGDEMGLGKTLQTISLLAYLKEEENVVGPSLIICPLSVLSSWCNEMSKWAPTLKYFRLHASGAEEQARQRQELANHATKYDVILTTYEMAKVPALVNIYQRTAFHYLVLDEGHKIKGHTTQISQAVRRIRAGNKLLLTGTPLQNNLVELWSLLNCLHPDVFTISEPFSKHFDLGENIVDKAFLAKTQHLLELFMLRRLKREVETKLPPKLETKVYCPLSKTQIFWYKSLLVKDVGMLEREVQNHNVLKSLFMQLRKCCNHPFVFEGAEVDPDETSLKDLVAASGKLSVLDMLLQSLFQKGNRSVIFSQFTSILDVIEDYCIARGWKYCRLDGSTDRARRNYIINRFNERDSPYFLFLLSTRSGGMGLNLQTADTCILYDSDWNPQSDIQAMGRVHRIGQTKKVHVYRLVSKGTVEERMLERAEKKLLLEVVNRETRETQHETEAARGLSSAELLEDIKFGCEAVFGSNGEGNGADNQLPSWEDIDKITDRARKESESAGNIIGGAKKSAQSFKADKEFSPSQHFGGADFRAIREKIEAEQKRGIPKTLQNIGYLWKEIQALENKKRVKKSRVVMVEGKGSGYGLKAIPVLASNNYDLEHGESSVFDRELSRNGKREKSKCAVPNKRRQSEHDNQDHCQVCGDGGSIVLCPRCPCSVHLECVGLGSAKDFLTCPHHRCFTCGKNRASAGGLLYPCEACSLSFCEDCLPEKGVTFLEGVPRFEDLGFNSTKHVAYIHCSNICARYSRENLGFVSVKSARGECPERLDLSHNFGASNDLEAALAKEEEGTGRGRPRRSSVGTAVTATARAARSPSIRAVSNETVTGKSTPISLSDDDDVVVVGNSADSPIEID